MKSFIELFFLRDIFSSTLRKLKKKKRTKPILYNGPLWALFHELKCGMLNNSNSDIILCFFCT